MYFPCYDNKSFIFRCATFIDLQVPQTLLRSLVADKQRSDLCCPLGGEMNQIWWLNLTSAILKERSIRWEKWMLLWRVCKETDLTVLWMIYRNCGQAYFYSSGHIKLYSAEIQCLWLPASFCRLPEIWHLCSLILISININFCLFYLVIYARLWRSKLHIPFAVA